VEVRGTMKGFSKYVHPIKYEHASNTQPNGIVEYIAFSVLAILVVILFIKWAKSGFEI
jgi:hypothetical protein